MVNIRISDFPAGSIYVRMKGGFVRNVSKQIETSRLILDKKRQNQVYNLTRGQKTPLSLIVELSKTFDFPDEYIEKNIKLITSVKNTSVGLKNPKFPFNFNTPEGCQLISAVMGDGEINSQLQVRYNNQNKELINQVLYCAKNVFGDVDYKIYYRKDKVYQLHFPKIIGLMIISLRLKPMNKVKTDNKIPEFVFKTNKKNKSAFLAQFYSDEGNVRIKDRRLQVKQTNLCFVTKSFARKNPERYCSKVLLGMKKLLSYFGINSGIYLESFRAYQTVNKADWSITIYGKENLKKFRKDIGFFIDYKNEQLNACIESYKFPSAPRDKRLDFALLTFGKVQRKKGFVTKISLAKECKRSVKTTTYYLVDLTKKGLIKCIEMPRNEKGHNLPRRYVLR